MIPVVVKVGGGLLGVPGALDATCAAVAELGRRESVVVVPGGGALADAVRSLDRRLGLSPDAAHWMAILAMDQSAHLLAERIEGAVLAEEPGAIGAALAAGQVAVLAPSRWLRAADPLPHSWDASSDSISVFVAVALDAKRLILVKPAEVGPDGVDGGFGGLVPVGLEVSVTGWERFAADVRGASPPTAAPPAARPAPAG
jgi:5-(aminomethyl)-3-furanmethanol phosphate kinase